MSLSNSSLRRDELHELAQLQMAGCLEDSDTERLERLFSEAPPSVQAEILRMQAEIAADDALLPDAQPERSLRWRVVAAVLEAVGVRERAEQERLAPIATIGTASRAHSRPRIAGMEIPSGLMADGAQDGQPLESAADAVRDDAEREAWTALLAAERWRKSAVVWRGACVASVAALAAALAFNVWIATSATQVSRLALERITGDQLRTAVGPSLTDFLGQRALVRGLAASSPAVNSSATVLLAPTLDSVLVTWIDLAPNRTYTLRVQGTDGSARPVGTFEVREDIGGARLALPAGAAAPASRWEIADDRGVVVLRH